MPVSKIVVGVDHSDRSDRALRRGVEIAAAHDADVIVEYALDVGSSQKLKSLLERVAVEETRERAGQIAGAASIKYKVDATAGRPFQVLRDVGKDCEADLIVLGTHRSGKDHSIFAGSTARRLINEAPAPVLIVGSPPEAPYRRVLVGFDDSPAARKAFQFARMLAPDARFTVLTACMIPFSSRNEDPVLKQQVEDDARRMTIEALRKQGVTDPGEVEIVTRVGESFGTILKVQREVQPDLLVLGTSMPALYRQMFGGGIVDMIAADPPCDLLVVKS